MLILWMLPATPLADASAAASHQTLHPNCPLHTPNCYPPYKSDSIPTDAQVFHTSCTQI